MADLRIVTDDINDPLARDDAIAVIHEHWTAARLAYTKAIGQIGEYHLRWLIITPDQGITRWRMEAIRDEARLLAEHATQLADQLDQAVSVYGRAVQ